MTVEPTASTQSEPDQLGRLGIVIHRDLRYGWALDELAAREGRSKADRPPRPDGCRWPALRQARSARGRSIRMCVVSHFPLTELSRVAFPTTFADGRRRRRTITKRAGFGSESIASCDSPSARRFFALRAPLTPVATPTQSGASAWIACQGANFSPSRPSSHRGLPVSNSLHPVHHQVAQRRDASPSPVSPRPIPRRRSEGIEAFFSNSFRDGLEVASRDGPRAQTGARTLLPLCARIGCPGVGPSTKGRYMKNGVALVTARAGARVRASRGHWGRRDIRFMPPDTARLRMHRHWVVRSMKQAAEVTTSGEQQLRTPAITLTTKRCAGLLRDR